MVSYNMADLNLRPGIKTNIEAEADSKTTMTFYGQGLGLDKRPHIEEEETSQPSQSTLQGSQPSKPNTTASTIASEATKPEPAEYKPLKHESTGHRSRIILPVAAPISGDEQSYPKRKGVRKARKKIEAQPITDMFNEQVNTFDRPISIRTILQGIEFEISINDELRGLASCCWSKHKMFLL